MLSEIRYTDINEIVSKTLTGRVFNFADHRIKVKSAEVWGCGPNLNLRVSVKGDVNGDIYFQGIPRYEADSQRIVVQKFDFEVVTEEALLTSADWLLHSSFKDDILGALSIQLEDKIAKIPEAITNGIEQGKAGEKMDVSIKQWTFEPKEIWIRPDDIAILIVVHAKARIELKML